MAAPQASIRFRLIAGFALIAFVLASMAIYFGRFVERQHAGLERLRTEQDAFFVLNRVANSFVGFQAVVVNRESSAEQIAAAREAFDQRLAAYAAHNPKIAEAVASGAATFATRAERMRAASAGGDAAALAAATADARQAVIGMSGQLRQGFDDLDQRYKALLAGELATQKRWRGVFHVGVGTALLLLLAYFAFLLQTIVRPLGATVAGIRALRQNATLPALPQHAEFGQISRVLDELRDATQRIRDMAYHDAQTSLISRPRFEQWLGEAAQRAQRHGQPLTVVLIELLQMREIVSAYGPAVAARCLRVAAERLARSGLGTPAPARYGDLRFGLLLPQMDLEQTLPAVRELLQTLRLPVTLDGLNLRLHAVAGIARLPHDGADGGPLLAAAETALVSAALGGSGTVATFDAGLSDTFRRDFSLLQDLERGLGQDEFVPYYEPIVDCSSGSVIAAEALVRWRHPLRGLLKPAEFLAVAERGGQVAAVDARLFEQAIAQLGRWQSSGRMLRLGLNLSPRHLTAVTVERLEEALRQSGVQASDLVAELTETAMITPGGETDAVIRELHALGTKICLDDFGTGYSSLSYVRRLPIERLKVDRSFVSEIGRSPAAERIIEATLSLARSIGIVVVAEGVETREQMAWLRERGCVRQQGWLYAEAQPAANFEQWLDRSPAQLRELLGPVAA